MNILQDNLIVIIPCIFVLAFAIYLIHGCICGREITDKDYEEWCKANGVEYDEENEVNNLEGGHPNAD